jgi:phosphotransferase system enzyme I (PtsP)
MQRTVWTPPKKSQRFSLTHGVAGVDDSGLMRCGALTGWEEIVLSSIAPAGPRQLLRRLREVMASGGLAHERLNRLVKVIAANMVAEVCSVYVIRGGKLELFATEGLNPDAVHITKLDIGEGLVGTIAENGRPLALPEARNHPKFVYRPETGEEMFHSLMGVPMLQGGRVVGVLVVQNQKARQYTDDEMEAMQTVAMVLAEMVGGGLLAEAPDSNDGVANGLPQRLEGTIFSEGLGYGHAVLHDPQIIVEHHIADDINRELQRLNTALSELRDHVDDMLHSAFIAPGGESREILETYRMFANDRGWISRLREAVRDGLTAEAAVERVQIDNHNRMEEIADPYLRERLHDLEDLSNRLMRHLTGRQIAAKDRRLPENAVIVARNMGPAELLDYDIDRVNGILLEEGSNTAHVAIVARALQLPVVGRIERLIDNVQADDEILVDSDNGQVFLRPNDDVRAAFSANIEIHEQREARFAALRDEPAVSADGVRIGLNINAGLLADLPHLDTTGADGIGLFRTEFHFMVRATLPTVRTQRDFYGRVFEQSGDRRVLFRTLDVGGDKVLPYLRRYADEENPAMGWRAIRLSLDRPVLLRMQLRALLQAAALHGRELNVMFPMVAEVGEFDQARNLLDREIRRAEKLGGVTPPDVRVGTMFEVPSLSWQLDWLLPKIDFLSIGSNDLVQFLFASDRSNPRLSQRYDVLSPAVLLLLRDVVARCDEAGVPVSLCGEAAGRPLEAMGLLAIGLRNISMATRSIGAVKLLVRALDLSDLSVKMTQWLQEGQTDIRARLRRYADENEIPI